MSSPTQSSHLVSLVLQSKKALQYGEQLCSRAHAVSNESAHASVDIVALDAKVHWVTESVREQLKLVSSVAKALEEKRAYLQKQIQAWDTLRAKHSDALDGVLESLGSQLVPPDFHQSASGVSSPFGSQHSDDERGPSAIGVGPNERSTSSPNHSPSSTLRHGLHNRTLDRKISSLTTDRSSWKTLRDFVDDQAIEDMLETIENDRIGLDDVLAKTDEYPETLLSTINSIQGSLPEPQGSPMKVIEEVLTAQDAISTSMAEHLESLTSHYGQMANALQESEAGEAFGDEDLRDMNRDTDELPLIMTELEESAETIEIHHDKLLAAQDMSRTHISVLKHTVDNLDELGDIMEEMLQTQDEVQAKCEEELSGLHNHLLTLEHLRNRYISYQLAFNKLILELARRRQYREGAENFVRNMTAQLEDMTKEEDQVRKHFNSEFGVNLPEDLCLCIENSPTRWQVIPCSGDTSEFLPNIENDLIARDYISTGTDQEGALTGLRMESPKP